MPDETTGLYDPSKRAEPTETAVDRDPKTGRFQKTGISSGLARQAKEYGLTDDAIAEMDVDDVREFVRDARQDRRDSQTNERFERLFQAKEATQPAAPANLQAEPVASPKSFDFGEIGDQLDPKFKASLDKLIARVDKLESETADLPQVKEHVVAQVRQTNESFGRRVEKAFAKYPHIFGTGTIDKIDKDSPEFDFRMAAVKAHRKAGGSADDLEANVDDFVKARFQAKEPEAELDEIEKWERGISDKGVYGRPTQRGVTEVPPGKEKALEGVRARMPKVNGRGERPERGAYLNQQR